MGIFFILMVFFLMSFAFAGVHKLFGASEKRSVFLILGVSLAAAVSVGAYSARVERKRAVSAEMKRQTEREETDHRNKVSAASNEAARVTKEVTEIYVTSPQLADSLERDLTQAFAGLASAEAEYVAHAYAPFWDAIEGVAGTLGRMTLNLRLIASNAQQYERLLDGRRHTFPRFSVDTTTLAAPQEAAHMLGEVVRRGQQSFEFSMIWEQRRTRDVLIAGFGSLADAVAGMGDAVTRSYALCCDAINAVTSTVEYRVSENTLEVSRGADASEALLTRFERQKRN
jgi:hypothetical protein